MHLFIHLVFAVLVVLNLLSLSGCGDDDSKKSEPEKVVHTPAPSTHVTDNPGDNPPDFALNGNVVANGPTELNITPAENKPVPTEVKPEETKPPLRADSTPIETEEKPLDLPGFGDLADDVSTEVVEYRESLETPSSTGSICSKPGFHSNLPDRPSSAKTGSAVVQEVLKLLSPERDALIIQEALSGNIPSQVRQFAPVVIQTGGKKITICVSKDYLSIGSDQDNVRFPLGLPATYELASGGNFIIPTTVMVDAIFKQADVKLNPSPKPPTKEMETTRYINEHDQTIDSQLGAKTGLVAGHKKDIVLSNRLLEKSGRIVIYGWHQSNGKPIQSETNIHGANYADYSHGIRLVARKALVDGKEKSLIDLLKDSNFGRLLSTRGAINAELLK